MLSYGGQLSAYAAKKAWVQFDSNTKTLTFYYNGKGNLANNEFNIPGTESPRPEWNTGNQDTKYIRDAVEKVVFDKSFASVRPTTCSYWFNGFTKLTTIEGLGYLNTSEITTMRYMFASCQSLTSLDLTSFDTQKVTDMLGMFGYCYGLKSLDLSSFNTQKVTRMESMFTQCYNLETIYTSSTYVVDNVTESSDMFFNCPRLKGDIAFNSNYRDKTYATADGGYFTDKVYTRPWVKYADGTLTFNYGYKKTLGSNEYFLNTDLNKPGWESKNSNVTKVVFDGMFSVARPTSCYYWFHGCKLLEDKNITGLNYLNTSETKYLRDMFWDCPKLTSLDLSSFNTEKCEDMAGMFRSCSGLTSLNISSFKTDKVTDMIYMFYGCSNIETLDLTNFNTSKVKEMEHMFYNCSKLKTIYASDNFTTSQVTYSINMFTGCTALEGNIKWNANNATDKTYASTAGYLSDKALIKPWVQYTANTGTLTFRYSSKKTFNNTTEFAMNTGQNSPAWNKYNSNVKKVVFEPVFADARPTSTWMWFNNCGQLTSDNIEGLRYLNTSEVTTLEFMFKECSKLTTLDLSTFNTANVTSIRRMVSGCRALETLKLPKFDTGKLESLFCTFAECNSLKNLDLTGINTENVTTMGYMLTGCSSLVSLDLSNFNTAKVTDMVDMFRNCSNLMMVLASDKFVLNSNLKGENMFSGCTSLVGSIAYDPNCVDKTYAKIQGGYFTDKNYAPTPWVKYADGILTFKYSYKPTLEENEYRLNSSSVPDWKNTPSWNNHCSDVTTVVFEASFKMAQPTTCYKWFYRFDKLKTIKGIEYLNTSNVRKLNDMFNNCSSLTSLDLTSFNTENVVFMNRVFYNCSSLVSLDLSSFNTKDVSEMENMFNKTKLKSIYVGENFVTDKVYDYNGMFGSDKTIIHSLPNNYEKTKTNKVFASNTVKPYVSINPNAEYGTLCVPLGSTLAESSYSGFDKLYTIKSADKDKGTITMVEATEIEPGVAYVYRRNLPEGDTESIITFSADKEESTAVTAPKNDGSLLKGTFSRITAPGGCYILQTDGNFHPVSADNTTLGVGAYRAYLDLSSFDVDGGYAKAYKMVFEDNQTTAIDGISEKPNNQPKTYFDLMGRRIATPKAGELYIVNGKKVMYKN